MFCRPRDNCVARGILLGLYLSNHSGILLSLPHNLTSLLSLGSRSHQLDTTPQGACTLCAKNIIVGFSQSSLLVLADPMTRWIRGQPLKSNHMICPEIDGLIWAGTRIVKLKSICSAGLAPNAIHLGNPQAPDRNRSDP